MSFTTTNHRKESLVLELPRGVHTLPRGIHQHHHCHRLFILPAIAIASRCPCHSHCIAARRRDRHATWYEQLPLNHLDIMSVLLETTFGDLVLDLDVDGSPALCKNILKLAKARYYTNTLIYNIVPGKYCQMGGKRASVNEALHSSLSA